MAPDRFRMFVNAHIHDIAVVHYLGVKPWMCTRASCDIICNMSVTLFTISFLQATMTACHTNSIIKVTHSTICGGSSLEKCAPQCKLLAEILGTCSDLDHR
jgi:hypothetical protein